MPKIRKQYQKGFTTLDNTPLNDESLSWKAKGLFAYLWSKPDDWDYRVTEVARHATDGIGSTSTGVNELEQAGYLKRKQKNKNGVFGDSVWTLSEQPIFKNPLTENPSSDNALTEEPYTENRKLLNTDLLNTNSTNKRTSTNKLLADAQHSFQEITTLWQNNWGFPNGIAQQDLTEWSKEFGNDLVYYCVEFALRHNVTARGADPYLNRKLSDYRKQGIKTVQAAIESDQRHEQQMSREYQQKNNSAPRKPKKRIYD
ncbi:DnaD domain protein [Limosilactobacillus reuteri]|uniref:DnaD domain-containing protein n=1 Tax=Limosilactobacillus reuteri TaxID=1598 RepID=UPI0023495252|nr:DnaD domain protein [Limosilactobacillus reuteri]MDC6077451.1 DnaD domain protein [Limosilactobacillus reuteri]